MKFFWKIFCIQTYSQLNKKTLFLTGLVKRQNYTDFTCNFDSFLVYFRS